MKPTSVLSLGSIAMVLMLGVGYLVFGVADVKPFREYTTSTMVLTDSGGLGPRSPILLSGVRVGEVTSINRTPGGAEVKFRVEGIYRIPVTSSVVVENLSALGEPYIAFKPTGAGGPYLRNGQRVETSRITMPLSIPDAARTMTDLLNQLDPRTINSLVSTLHQGFSGLDEVVPNLSRSTDLLAATLLTRMPEIRRILVGLQNIGDDMQWTGPTLAESGPLWGQFGVAARDVADALARFVRVGKMPDDYVGDGGLIPFLNRMRNELDKIGPDLAKLAPVLQPLAASGAQAIPQLDISALIAQSLAATSADGSIPVQINVK